MERIVSKGILRADGKLDFQGELEGIDPAAYKNLEVFKGVAATTDTTMNLFRHSDKALQQLADAYTYGKGMYTDHYLAFSNRIGRTLKGTVNDTTLTGGCIRHQTQPGCVEFKRPYQHHS